MRSREEVLAKFQDLRKRRRSQRREELLTRCHMNCVHNVRFRIKGHGKCGFCRNPKIIEKTNGEPFVCDEEGTAKRCRHYECRNSQESADKDFEEVLRNPARCGEKYPKLAILIWFLQDTKRRTRMQRLWLSFKDMWRSIASFVFWRWW